MTFDEWFAAIVKEDANPAGLMKEQDFARECWEAGYAACSRADAEAAIARARTKRGRMVDRISSMGHRYRVFEIESDAESLAILDGKS